MVTRNLSTTEAKNRFSAVINAVADDDETVVVEQHGRPKAAIISMVKLEEYETLVKRERRKEAIEQLKELQRRVSARNTDLTEEQALEIADEIVRAAVDNLIKKGIIRYTPEEK